MNGSDGIKKAAIEKAKKVANAGSSNGQNNGKKRRKQDLKPIITTEQQAAAGNPYRCVRGIANTITLHSCFPLCIHSHLHFWRAASCVTRRAVADLQCACCALAIYRLLSQLPPANLRHCTPPHAAPPLAHYCPSTTCLFHVHHAPCEEDHANTHRHQRVEPP